MSGATTYETRRRRAQKRRESRRCKSMAEIKQTPATRKNPKTKAGKISQTQEICRIEDVLVREKVKSLSGGKWEVRARGELSGARRKTIESTPPMNRLP